MQFVQSGILFIQFYSSFVVVAPYKRMLCFCVFAVCGANHSASQLASCGQLVNGTHGQRQNIITLHLRVLRSTVHDKGNVEPITHKRTTETIQASWATVTFPL